MVILLYFSLFFRQVSAQEVESRTYAVMLNNLLDHSVPEISVSDVNLDDYIILDARSAEEYRVSKIKNALRVGYDDFSMDKINQLNKDHKILVYCSVGYRSEKVAKKLINEGYKDVFNLYGGLFEWVNQQKEVVDKDNQPTKKIHAFSRNWGIWLNKGEKVY